MLYKTLEDVKDSAGFVAISNSSNNFKILKEDLKRVETEVRTKYLGIGQFDLLNTQFNADAIAGGSDTELLLGHVRRYVSYKALYTAAPKLNVNFEKSGISSQKSDNSVPAREWMLISLQKQLLEDACGFLDDLLAFLQEKKDVFTLWRDGSTYTVNKSHFINSADDFNDYFSIGGSTVTFLSLLPVLTHVEERHIKKLLGTTFFDAIKAEIEAAVISAETQTLLDEYLKRISAYATINRACSTLPVRFQHNGILTNEYVAGFEKGMQKDRLKEAELLQQRLEADIVELQTDLVDFLNATATDAIYISWFESSLYIDPAVEVVDTTDRNTDRSFFRM